MKFLGKKLKKKIMNFFKNNIVFEKLKNEVVVI